MTKLATKPDWSLLDDPAVRKACEDAARATSAKYGGRAVASLAEADDLLQEAYILAATRPSLRDIDAKLLRFRLVQGLTNMTRYRYRDASSTASLDAMNEGDADE